MQTTSTPTTIRKLRVYWSPEPHPGRCGHATVAGLASGRTLHVWYVWRVALAWTAAR